MQKHIRIRFVHLSILIYISIILFPLSSFFNTRILTHLQIGYEVTQTIIVLSPVTFTVLQSEECNIVSNADGLSEYHLAQKR